MGVDTIVVVPRFLAVLSLLAWAGTIVIVALVLIGRRRPRSFAAYLLADIRSNAVWLACAVATVAMLGSLYLSEIAGFPPCPLCWLQRICMYPLAAVLFLGGLKRVGRVWKLVLPQAVVGAGIAAYHAQLQAFPKQVHFCTLGSDSCLNRWVSEFGFVTIPFMSLAAFAFIITMMLLVRSGQSTEVTTHGLVLVRSEGLHVS